MHASLVPRTTPITEDYEEDNPYRPTGYVVEVEETARTLPTKATLPTEVIHDLVYVVTEVANSDGDVRGLPPAAKDALEALNAYFRDPALGPNPWLAEEEDEANRE